MDFKLPRPPALPACTQLGRVVRCLEGRAATLDGDMARRYATWGPDYQWAIIGQHLADTRDALSFVRRLQEELDK